MTQVATINFDRFNALRDDEAQERIRIEIFLRDNLPVEPA